ncbi:MAG: diguanylate cyclase domain-containing protein [Solidesulfovibrio sp. DCME]|uniref:diguanylate cyclase domain-containing protein n=1 Tax=Solidesulfovibrio sp. DCME TaxID=3447380 RepID=UPI003D130E5B
MLRIVNLQTDIVKLGHDLGSVLAFVIEQVQILTGAQGAVVELAEGDEMVYRAASGIAGPQLGLRLARRGSLSGLCIETGEVLLCGDSETDARVDREACRKVGLRSMIVAPLCHNGTVVGVFKIASPDAAFFTSGHVTILRLLAELIAASMYYSARYEASELYHRATHDLLTGLANRALFYDRLRQALALARRRATPVAVLNLDMDGLKAINDRHGHRAGDAAIRECALRIHRAARASDTVARLGGDEFGVILSELLDRGGARQVVERMAREIRAPFVYEETPLAIDASIGLAVFPEDATEMDTLVEEADRAMYAVKRSRKGEPD